VKRERERGREMFVDGLMFCPFKKGGKKVLMRQLGVESEKSKRSQKGRIRRQFF